MQCYCLIFFRTKHNHNRILNSHTQPPKKRKKWQGARLKRNKNEEHARTRPNMNEVLFYLCWDLTRQAMETFWEIKYVVKTNDKMSTGESFKIFMDGEWWFATHDAHFGQVTMNYYCTNEAVRFRNGMLVGIFTIQFAYDSNRETNDTRELIKIKHSTEYSCVLHSH